MTKKSLRWKTGIVTASKENTMTKHNMHYLDLNPEARPPEQPSDLAIIAGAFALVTALACVLLFAFSL